MALGCAAMRPASPPRDRQLLPALARTLLGSAAAFEVTLLEFQCLFEPPAMPLFPGKLRVQKILRQLARQIVPDDARSQHQHVHVVVLDSLMRRIAVVAIAGADSRNLIGRHRCADAASANHDAPVGALLDDRQAHRFGVIGIVGRLVVVNAQIGNGVAQALQKCREVLLQVEAGVVGTQGNFHPPLPYLSSNSRAARAALYYAPAPARRQSTALRAGLPSPCSLRWSPAIESAARAADEDAQTSEAGADGRT